MSRAIKGALGVARRYGKKYADGGSIRDVVFDPTPMSRKTKTPNERVMEGHQEFEPGYSRGWDWGGGASIMNSRGQTLYTQRTADGGTVDPEDESLAFAEKPKQEAPIVGTEGVPSYDPAQAPTPTPPAVMEPDLQGAQTGQVGDLDPEKYGIDEHGRIIDKATWEPVQFTRRPNVLPITKTPEGNPEFAMPKALDIAGNLGGGWSVPVTGAEKILGAGMAIPKAKPTFKLPPKAGDVGRTWFDLPPQEVQSAKLVGGQKGTSPGGLYQFPDGTDRYVKQAKSLDHAKNEVLAAKLYELAGVPVAKTELTQLDGKPAVASRMINGKQLSEFQPWQYEDINHLQQHMPADAWLANGDVIGAGMENPKGNIIATPTEGMYGMYDATRIDFGGALRYSGLGSPKKFDADVGKWLSGLKDEYKNPTAAEAFYAHQIDPNNVTAQKIAAISNDDIFHLVYQYGPTDLKAKEQLAKTLIERRDALAKAYGIEKPSNVVPMKSGELAGYSFKDPAKDALKLWKAHDGHPEYIAHDMYKMAEVNPEYVDQVFKKLPEGIYKEVHDALSTKIQREGDPWAALEMKPKAQAIPSLKLMQLNKTHGLDQVVNAIKVYHKDELNVGKTITEKQKAKVADMIGKAASMDLAQELKKLDPAEQKNVLSWLPPAKAANVKALTQYSPEKAKQPIPDIDKIQKSHSLYQIISAIKNYSPMHSEVPYHATQSVPKEISKFSPGEIMKEMEPLSLTQKEKVMEWLPESTKEKMVHLGQEQQAKKQGFVGQEYYDALEPVQWQNYKPKGATSVRHKLSGPTLKHILKHGFNPDVALFKGGSHEYAGTYPQTLVDPVTEPHRLSNPSEKALFLSDHPTHAEAYGALGGEYIARPQKVFTVDWKDLTGSEDYSSHHMKRIIDAAREKGADLVVVKGVADVSGYGHVIQDQYAFLNTHVLRGPDAKFDVNKLHLRYPLAGLVGGGLFSYGTLRGQADDKKMARGGRNMPYKSRAQAAYFNIHRKELEAQGVDVGEWNRASKGMKLPKHKDKGGAIASALRTARKYAKGGDVMSNLALRGSSIKLSREGLINSSIPGRTDKIPMKVRAGSYILPADIPSALGQGNTMAGGEILKKMFSSGPYGMATMKGHGRPRIPKKGFQDGGEVEEETSEHVPIIAAGGEYEIPPEVVKDIGHGNMKAGHDVLDKFVLKVRKHHIQTLKKLPAPKK